MIFGEFASGDAEGLILAHAVRLASCRLTKGHRLGSGDVARLKDAGIGSVIACRMEEGDLGEDAAAERCASAIDGNNLRLSEAATGRVNFYATCNGLFVANKDVVDRFNRVDPAITLACLADHSDVREGDLVATVKIIPLAVAGASVEAARAILCEGLAFQLKYYQSHAVQLIATELPSLKPSVMDKTARVLEQRLAPSLSELVAEQRVEHRAEAVAAAIENALRRADARPSMIVVFGASAMCDAVDVIPESIRMAGGVVDQVGLPVDPGNLLVLGHVDGVPVIGAPGCARSPKENGFDWVLNRLLAGEVPTSRELTRLGVGGLLMEIPSRPLPRELAADIVPQPLRMAVVLLAAGKSSRMGEGGRHKLLAEFEGEPLVRRSARIALEAGAGEIIVVTGHRAGEIAASLEGLGVTYVHNPDYGSGMAGSLKGGFAAASAGGADGVLVLLADMPGISVSDLQALVAAFRTAGGRSIVRAVAAGKRGNPVILPRSTFEAVKRLEGDIGARPIIETAGLPIIDVEIGLAARLDVDTPEAVVAAGGVLKG
ncbi:MULTISPECIES: NTP transferase domain-containing protein [Alphaproteobacteria]|uniref:4-diphosphocytidyl-2C-methyl-D-erythritol kinase n=2 Tax=Alphaproteobacteria TaxID=28211 RepID=A0A512HCP7_9HYPH|nr:MULTISPECIES: molybdopterin-binding/glycosyltransferase family 2 protein [Alphaproteobacteria]GEO83213.1 4-diphosphocytidyl-2C-methyl-D-erythritol kinase [Ciceribacter naphthalenivorans]GLR20392.1 4-diphosphocytidyl-2C-methyl-D-erythritol kinase [Ciceribacter naphthalenivorans]GLT03248.1 4-diphosphocytidyl-2C-methyl-D-erythritol kinase [Sphingomonas psychrolutea]